MKDSDNKSETG